MRILAVDDDSFIQDLLPVVLSNSGYHDVTVCQSSAQALRLLQASDVPFECILLDIMMPDIDGIQLCQKMRTMPGYRNTPIIMLTAKSDKTHIDRSFSAGATDYITKPFDVTEIGARVRVAEKLNAAYSARLRSETRMTEDDRVGSQNVALSSPLPIDGVQGVVEYAAIENYLRKLSRSEAQLARVFAVKLDQAAELHSETNDGSFSDVITETARCIAESLTDKHSYLLSYFGGGTFVCTYHSDCAQNGAVLERTIQKTLSARALKTRSRQPLTLTVSTSQTLKPNFSSAKRSDRVFRVAMAQAEARLASKIAPQAMASDPV